MNYYNEDILEFCGKIQYLLNFFSNYFIEISLLFALCAKLFIKMSYFNVYNFTFYKIKLLDYTPRIIHRIVKSLKKIIKIKL